DLPQPEKETTLVSVRGLDAWHGDRQFLFGIDLTVLPRQCVALVGESGSGKTTLARCIAGLHRDFKGELALHGKPLAAGARARSRDDRRRLQYIFQSPYSSLNPRKTIPHIVSQPPGRFFDLAHHHTHDRGLA